MKKTLLLLILLASFGLAQQSATISGLIRTEMTMPENTRVGMHIIDTIGGRLIETSSVTPVGGTFSLTATLPQGVQLQPFTSANVTLPGLQNNYTITPNNVNYVRAVTNVYVDRNANSTFDGDSTDPLFLGIASVQNPIGFFNLIYVDRAATLAGGGVSLNLQAGWNIFTVRFPEGGSLTYAAQSSVNDVVLDVFLP